VGSSPMMVVFFCAFVKNARSYQMSFWLLLRTSSNSWHHSRYMHCILPSPSCRHCTMTGSLCSADREPQTPHALQRPTVPSPRHDHKSPPCSCRYCLQVLGPVASPPGRRLRLARFFHTNRNLHRCRKRGLMPSARLLDNGWQSHQSVRSRYRFIPRRQKYGFAPALTFQHG